MVFLVLFNGLYSILIYFDVHTVPYLDKRSVLELTQPHGSLSTSSFSETRYSYSSAPLPVPALKSAIAKRTLNLFQWRMILRSQDLDAAAAAAGKSLQSCLTLCDPTDGSPPGSPVPGILQARSWVAISFSNV